MYVSLAHYTIHGVECHMRNSVTYLVPYFEAQARLTFYVILRQKVDRLALKHRRGSSPPGKCLVR